MGGKYQAYSEYKDSTQSWIGEVPEHWNIQRLGQFFDERRVKVSDKDYPPLSVTMNGIVPQLETAAKTDAGENRKLVLKDDFVINSRSDRKGSAGVSGVNGSVSLISIVLKPRNISPKYAHHLLRSHPFQEEFYRFGKGIVADLWSTNVSEMKNIKLPIPSLIEQEQIASFLDHEIAKIDTLIDKQQQLIKLLKEKRQAVISHAVTKGLNTDAPMKDSGVEWLGEVPEGWEILPIRRFVDKIEQGVSPLASNYPPGVSEEGVLKISAVKKGIYDELQSKTLDSKTTIDSRYQIRKGDLLVTRANTPQLVADTCVVTTEPKRKIMLCDLIYRLNTNNKVRNDFLCLCLLSDKGRLQIELDARGSSMTMAKVAQEHIKSWIFAMPPLKEQAEIVNFIRKKTTKIDDVLEKSKSGIDLLKERRTALISASVTGKIDIRN